MKAYFSVIGVGLGHITRCVSIAKLLEDKGIESVFSTYGKASRITEKENFKTYESKKLRWYEDGNGRIDYEKTLLKSPMFFLRMANHFRDENKRIKEEEPDVIVTDSRYSVIPASKVCDAPRIYITNQPRLYMPHPENGKKNSRTHLERVGSWWNYNLLCGHDKILLPDFPLPESISYRHMLFDNAPQKFKNSTEFVGPIAPHRPDNTDEDNIERVCRKYGVEPGNFIYVAFSGPGSIKKEIRDAIFEVFSDYEIPAIMGTGKPGKSKISKNGNLILVDGWIEEREELLKGAKLVISRAGLSTLSELIAFGKKTIVIPQSKQPEQQSNADGMEKKGFATKIEPFEIDSKVLKREIEKLLSSQEAEKAIQEYKKKAKKWKGEKKSAEIITGMVD